MKFLSLSKNKTFIEKLLNHTVNMLGLMLTFIVLTRKSFHLLWITRRLLTLSRLSAHKHFALQKTENSILITATYTWIIPSKSVLLYKWKQGKNGHNFARPSFPIRAQQQYHSWGAAVTRLSSNHHYGPSLVFLSLIWVTTDNGISKF